MSQDLSPIDPKIREFAEKFSRIMADKEKL